MSLQNIKETADLPRLLKSADRSVQIGQVDLSNLDSVYIDSETTSSENTLPPLTPPSSEIDQKEEEEDYD